MKHSTAVLCAGLIVILAIWQVSMIQAATSRSSAVLQPTPQSPPAVKRQPPKPDGSIVHIVQQGDTLSTIAYAYGVDINQIRTLNNLSTTSNNIIIGQRLLIKPATQATSAPTEASTVAPTMTPTATEIPPTPTLLPITHQASVCVKAFNDANQNHWDDTAEQPLPGTQIKLVQPSGTATAAEAPTCFNDLPNGMFTIIALPPTNFGLTTPPQLQVQLSAGQQIALVFGAAQGYHLAQSTLSATETVTPPQKQASTASVGITELVAQYSGLIVLAVAGLLFVGGMSVALLTRRM